MAFGGNTHHFSNNGNNGGTQYQYAFASHSGWNHNRQYFWHGHHYCWYNNGWFIIDPFPWYPGYYGPGYYGYYGYNYGGPLSVEVQQALARQGYYNGPIDGVVGRARRRPSRLTSATTDCE